MEITEGMFQYRVQNRSMTGDGEEEGRGRERERERVSGAKRNERQEARGKKQVRRRIGSMGQKQVSKWKLVQGGEMRGRERERVYENLILLSPMI